MARISLIRLIAVCPPAPMSKESSRPTLNPKTQPLSDRVLSAAHRRSTLRTHFRRVRPAHGGRRSSVRAASTGGPLKIIAAREYDRCAQVCAPMSPLIELSTGLEC